MVDHMSGSDLALVITAIGGLVVSFGTIFMQFMTLRQSQANACKIEQAKEKIDQTAQKTGEKLQEVHDSTNGKMDKLIEETRKSSHAEGKEEERREETVRKENGHHHK